MHAIKPKPKCNSAKMLTAVVSLNISHYSYLLRIEAHLLLH